MLKRNARLGLAPRAFDLKPCEPAIEAVRDCRRRLRRSAIAFHTNRPGFRFRPVGFAYGFFRYLASVLGANLGAFNAAAVNDLTGFGPHPPFSRRVVRWGSR